MYIESKVNVRPITRRSYESLITLYLKPYFGSWKIGQLSAADIEQFRNGFSTIVPVPVLDAFAKRIRESKPALSQARAKQRAKRKTLSARSVNKALTLLVMIFNYASRHRWVDFNPAKHVEKLREQVSAGGHSIDENVLSPKEIGQLLNAAETAHRDNGGELRSNNYRLIIQFEIFTGVRSGEICGLQWGDVDWTSRQIYVRRSWKEGQFHKPKTKTSTRRIDLPESPISDLRAWKIACPTSTHDLVFPNLAGQPLSSPNLLQRGFYPALRRAGFQKIRFHDLRHTYASLLIANGEDIVRVSRLLGHAAPTITLNVYAHLLLSDHYGSADRLSDLVFGSKDVSQEKPDT